MSSPTVISCMQSCTLADRLRFALAGLVLFVYWSVCSLVFLPLVNLALLLRCQPRRRELGQAVLKQLFRGVAGILRRFGVIEVTYEGFERVKAHIGPVILAPNHPALWDAVFVLAEVDRAACVLKASLLCNPLLTFGARAAGFISNEPSHQMMRRCIELLRDGERILFFPEGTRTRPEHGRMNPLYGGLAIIARNSGAPVWPIIVRTSSRYLSKGWPLWRLPPEPIRIRISMGDPVVCSPEEDAQRFLDQLRESYIAAGCGVAE
ncbi:MAG: lysophospholipid acyltransferase family protein [Verrucomicrobiota bacterium]